VNKLAVWLAVALSLAQCSTFSGLLIPLPPTADPVVALQAERPAPHIVASLRDLAQAAAARHGVPSMLVFSLIDRENAPWNAEAVSAPNSDGSVDLGLMQINSYCWDEFAAAARVVDGDPLDPVDNIEVGVSRLAALHAQMGNWFDAVMAYRMGAVGALRNLPDSSYDYARSILARWRNAGGTNG